MTFDEQKHLAQSPVQRRRFTYLDDILLLNRILFGVEGNGVAVLALFLQRGRLHTRQFAVHIQDLKRLRDL